MTFLASAILSMGVRLLPPQDRARYSEELDAELRSQPGWGRLPYAVSIALGMPRLRWELLSKVAGQPVPFCFVGMHRNLTVHPNPEDAEVIAHECVLCHRVHDPRQYVGRKDARGLAWFAAGQGK